MTRLQRAQLKQSELRSQIAAELDKDDSDRTEWAAGQPDKRTAVH